MTNEIADSNQSSTEPIGIAIVLMEDLGPQTCFNLSTLDELSSMYLAVKGFTAFMTGFERLEYGPGKIRGILQIPETLQYAVALDLNMRGSGFENDTRLQTNRTGVVCLIASEQQLAVIRRYYTETEQFLIEKFKAVTTINHLNESFCQTIIKEYNKYLIHLEEKTAEQGTQQPEVESLFEVSVLLALPKTVNLTARVIMDNSSRDTKGITLEEISKITKRKKKVEQLAIDNLLEKGLIVAIPPTIVSESIRYIAQ
ncbi:MAG: hypothetical protein ACTSSH_01195 [Candidatus Heimdallarchaeota archaeon]